MSSWLGSHFVIYPFKLIIQFLNNLFFLSIDSFCIENLLFPWSHSFLMFLVQRLNLLLQLRNSWWWLLFKRLKLSSQRGNLSLQFFLLRLVLPHRIIQLLNDLLWFPTVLFDDLIKSWLIVTHRCRSLPINDFRLMKPSASVTAKTVPVRSILVIHRKWVINSGIVDICDRCIRSLMTSVGGVSQCRRLLIIGKVESTALVVGRIKTRLNSCEKVLFKGLEVLTCVIALQSHPA